MIDFMSSNIKTGAGRKVFFLFPERLLAQGLIDKVVRNQYEAYVISNPEKIGPVMEAFPGSLFILDPQGASCPNNWDDGLKNWLSLKGIGDCRFYVVDLEQEEQFELADSSASVFSLSIGADKVQNTGTILHILDESSAMGQRKFIRFGNFGVTIAECSIEVEGQLEEGFVHDISAAGLSCSFQKELKLARGTKIVSLITKLEGREFSFSGEVSLIRNIDGKPIYVIMFDRRSIVHQREALEDFIYYSLQQKMDSIIQYL